MRPMPLVFAASLLCTACVGNVAGPSEGKEKKELVSDVKADPTAAARTDGSVLAKRAGR